MGVLLFFLLCLGIVLDAARVRGLPGVSVLPAPPGGLQRVGASVLGRWPAGAPVPARTAMLKVADALAWAVALVWRDLVVVLAAHSAATSTPAPDAMMAGRSGSAPAGSDWAGRVGALERGRAAAVMVRSVRREQHTVLADLSVSPSAVVAARRTTRLVAVVVLAAVLVVALVFAPGLAQRMGPGVWEGTLFEHLGVWLAGILDVLGAWWNGLSRGQQILFGAGLAALVVLSGGSLGLALGASGVATYGLSHAAGLASLTRDPKAATGSYLSHATPASVLLDVGEGALTFLPGNFTGAVAGRAFRDGVQEFTSDPAAFRAALRRELHTNPERGSTDAGSHLGQKASDVTVAEKSMSVGFTDAALTFAYQGMRSGGGHAMRHLMDQGLIHNSGSLASRAGQFEQLTSPILRSPGKTFDWRLGSTVTRAFAGETGGRQVVVFVAKEGPYQGRVLSAVTPDASQLAQWGLT